MVPNAEGCHFPIVVVPGGHRLPIRARRSGPHGNIVTQNDVLIRKPGPRSEVPQSAQEWDALFSRCFSNRRDEMLGQIRDLIAGAVRGTSERPTPVLESWTNRCVTRWESLVATLPPEAEARCPHGYFYFAYELRGDLRRFAPAEFPDVLRRSVVRRTGWPPFWYPSRMEIAPYPIDGVVECWLGGDQSDDRRFNDSAHSDFWRISPDGLAFLLRGYQDDGEGRAKASSFSIEIPIWRAGETLLHAAQFAENMVDGPTTINFIAHYTGLAGRRQTSSERGRDFYENNIARQDKITLSTTVEASAIKPNLPEIVQPLLAPLYALFDFSELSMDFVVAELTEMRGDAK